MLIETQEEINTTVKKNKNQKLIELAANIAFCIRGNDGRNYVVLKDKPHIAIPHSGANSQAVLAICNQYLIANSDWVGTSGINHLSSYLTAQCLSREPVEVHMRSGFSQGSIFLDYGDSDFRVLQVSQNFVKLVDTCPIYFTRGTVISQFPEITQATSSLTELRRFIRVRN